VLLFPLAGAQVTFGLGKLAHRAQQQAECRIGDLLVQDIRRVRDDDAVGSGPVGVDMVVADAECRNEFKFWETGHQFGTDLLVGIGHRKGADAIGDRGNEGIAVLRLVEAVDREGGFEALQKDGLCRPDQKDIGLRIGHVVLLIIKSRKASRPAPHQIISPTGCSRKWRRAPMSSAASAASRTR
jgi:hypothetical protein